MTPWTAFERVDRRSYWGSSWCGRRARRSSAGARSAAGSGQGIHDALGFVERYLETHGIGTRSLDHVLAPYVAASEAALPHLVEQLRGMADGAEQPFSLLMAANAFEEIYGQVELGTPTPQPLERCTDVVVDGPDGPLLGHTEQWYAGDQGAVGIVIDVADDGPTVLAPVVAGTLPLVGINEYGVAVGAMSLSARDERVGIPRALLARDVLDARDAADATARATRPGRAGGYTYQLAFPDGESRVVETTATRDAVMAANVHTNHALDPSVAEVTFPAAPGSLGRYERAASSSRRWSRRWRASSRSSRTTRRSRRASASIRIPPKATRDRRSCSPWSPNPLGAR